MEKRILIGSCAAKHWFPDFRETNDIDYIIGDPNKKNERVNDKRVEYHSSPAFNWLLKHEDGVASPNALYTIKLSHSYWNIHQNWDKTMYDIQFFQQRNASIIEEFYSLLYKDWELLHGKKKVNLNMSNEGFFGEHVPRKYIHDDLHKALAYYDEPMYIKLKVDKSKAWVDRGLFDKLSYGDKLVACREEIYVTALERHLIPSNFDMNVLIAYRRAIKQLITSMTKGWFARFLSENYRTLKNPDGYYKFKQIIVNKGL